MQEHRRRSKYLGHLPIGCTITLVSVDLSGIVSKETLDIFVGKLKFLLWIAGFILTQLRVMIDHSIPEKQEAKNESVPEEETTSHETIRELVAEEEWSDEEEMLQHVLRISALEYHKESSTGHGPTTTTTRDQAEDPVDEDNDDHTYDDWEWEEYVETSKSTRQRR